MTENLKQFFIMTMRLPQVRENIGEFYFESGKIQIITPLVAGRNISGQCDLSNVLSFWKQRRDLFGQVQFIFIRKK